MCTTVHISTLLQVQLHAATPNGLPQLHSGCRGVKSGHQDTYMDPPEWQVRAELPPTPSWVQRSPMQTPASSSGLPWMAGKSWIPPTPSWVQRSPKRTPRSSTGHPWMAGKSWTTQLYTGSIVEHIYGLTSKVGLSWTPTCTSYCHPCSRSPTQILSFFYFPQWQVRT